MKMVGKIKFSFFLFILTFPHLTLAQWDRGELNAASSRLPSGRLIEIIETTMNWLLAILGFIAIIGFVIAGLMYLTAGGSEEQAGKAKKAMVSSIVGIIVALLGFVVVQAVTTWLSGGSTQF